MTADTAHGTERPDQDHPSAPEPAPNLHEALLGGVSPDALVTAGSGVGEAATVSDESGPTEHTHAESEPAESEPAELAEDLTVVPEEAAAPVEAAQEMVEAATDTVETVAQALPETRPVALPTVFPPVADAQAARGRITDLANSPRISEVMGELGEVNTTVLTYLRGESAAAMAHWQALSGARTPADAIRLQVTEMQRAADASLSCFAALAKRAGRVTGVIARR